MAAPTQRVVIHAGFHKTGTSSVQDTLRLNGPLLYPQMALGLRPKLKPIIHAARGYSTWRDPISLAKTALRFGDYVRQLDLPPRRQLLISAEELAGHLPGRDTLADYSAAPDLMRVYAAQLTEIFGRRLDLTFVFSMRLPEPWLRSAYWEHVKASRMVLDFDDYADRYRGSTDLPAIVNDIITEVAPCKVEAFWLEDCADLPLGPATPILDLMRLTPERRAQLKPAPRSNVALGDAVLTELLALNRSDLDPDALLAAKKAVLARAGQSS